MYYLLMFLFGVVVCDVDLLQGWNHVNLHCRDNANWPVDWWIIYKPPSGDGLYWESGRNFTYITPDTSGKWQPSNKFITSYSMLQHTVSPLFRPTYQDHLASLVYDAREKTDFHYGSAALGVMMADTMGGVWLGHTVPGLLDITKDRLYFPENEIHNGHMMVCLSLDLVTLNAMAESLKLVEPAILAMQVPDNLKLQLPDWLSIRQLNQDTGTAGSKEQLKLEFLTEARSVRASMITRRPGDTRCIFKTFARNKKIILDVYGHGRRNNLCEEAYSVRNLDAISLKYAENIYYINNKTDRVCFAVSTAAHWQKISSSDPQYWSCTSNLENDDSSGKGGLILCFEDYHIWRSFDTLKVKEPEC